jgi:hypothetical protein
MDASAPVGSRREDNDHYRRLPAESKKQTPAYTMKGMRNSLRTRVPNAGADCFVARKPTATIERKEDLPTILFDVKSDAPKVDRGR